MPLRTCGAEQPGRGGLGTDTRSSVAAPSAVGTWRSNSPDARGRRACFTSFCNRHCARTDTTGPGQGGAVRPGDVAPAPRPPRDAGTAAFSAERRHARLSQGQVREPHRRSATGPAGHRAHRRPGRGDAPPVVPRARRTRPPATCPRCRHPRPRTEACTPAGRRGGCFLTGSSSLYIHVKVFS